MDQGAKHDEVETHWGRSGVINRIEAALREAGFDPGTMTPEILAPLDHLHTGGISLTEAQSKMIGLSSGLKVLDVGCGIGGPARFLASTIGCEVWGIDLIAEWAAAGQTLSERCGLSELVHIEQGNALDLAFDDESFDVAWCQHVTMNIQDKATLLAEVHRVLRPGGKFSVAQYCQGKGGDLHYPVPWANDPKISFLVTEDEMIGLFEAAGFRVMESRDLEKARGERPKPKNAGGTGKPQTVLGNHVVYGRSVEDIEERRRQMNRNLAEGRLTYQVVLAERV